jgi:hypothetical protein
MPVIYTLNLSIQKNPEKIGDTQLAPIVYI